MSPAEFEHQNEILRRQLWMGAWMNTARSDNCVSPHTATDFADIALKAYDNRFGGRVDGNKS